MRDQLLKKGWVISLNMIYSALSSIHADEDLKQKTKKSVSELITKRRVKYRFHAAPIVSAVACAAVFAAAVFGYNMYFTPVYALSIDINPSIEFGINRFDRVINVTGYNEDGKKLVENTDIKNMKYTDAVESLLNSESVQEYTENGADVVVTVSGGNIQKNEEIITAVENCHTQTHMYCYDVSDEEAQEARNYGLTPGKYRAYTELKKYEPNITPDEISGMTMREIREKISSYTGTDYSHGNGNGYRNNRGHHGKHTY